MSNFDKVTSPRIERAVGRAAPLLSSDAVKRTDATIAAFTTSFTEMFGKTPSDAAINFKFGPRC